MEFPSEQAFLRQVRYDWRERTWRAICREAYSKPPPAAIPALEVRSEGFTFHLHGINHYRPEIAGPHYLHALQRTVTAREDWFAEQGLIHGRYGFLRLPAVELPDGMVISTTRTIAGNIWLELSEPFLKLGKAAAARWSAAKNAEPADVGGVRPPRTAAEVLSGALHLPPRWAGLLPACLDIGLREEQGRPYRVVDQARSALMTAFLLEYARLTGAKDPIHFLSGRVHVPQMEYFFLHGIKDEALAEGGRDLARRFVEDPDGFIRQQAAFAARRQAEQLIGSAIGKVALVAPAWYALLYWAL